MTSSQPGPSAATGSSIAARRLRNQRLTGEGFADPASAVSWLGAVQSQLFAGGAWAIGQRCVDLDDAGFRAAFDSGAVLRTHVLRPTWHFVAPADLRWMLALTSPQVHAASALYYRKGGLDDDLFRRCADVIVEALDGDRHLTRAELADELGRHGIPAEGNRLAYIVMWCELEAIICSGPMRGRQHTYALVDDRIAPGPRRSADWSLGELARRYFTSHGPAQLRDFAWWSGLRISVARKGVALAASDLVEERVEGQSYFSGKDSDSTSNSPDLHLLSNFDEFVVAYQDRSALFSTPDQARALGGMQALTNNLIIRRGQVVGTWKPTFKPDRVRISLSLSVTKSSRDFSQSLDAAVARYGRFIGLPVSAG
jgi:hypothetical protein